MSMDYKRNDEEFEDLLARLRSPMSFSPSRSMNNQSSYLSNTHSPSRNLTANASFAASTSHPSMLASSIGDGNNTGSSIDPNRLKDLIKSHVQRYVSESNNSAFPNSLLAKGSDPTKRIEGYWTEGEVRAMMKSNAVQEATLLLTIENLTNQLSAASSSGAQIKVLNLQLADAKKRETDLLNTLREKVDAEAKTGSDAAFREKLLLSELRQVKTESDAASDRFVNKERELENMVKQLSLQLQQAETTNSGLVQQVERLNMDMQTLMNQSTSRENELVSQVKTQQQDIEADKARQREIIHAAEQHDSKIRKLIAAKDVRISQLLADVAAWQRKYDSLYQTSSEEDGKLREQIAAHQRAHRELLQQKSNMETELLEKISRKDNDIQRFAKEKQELTMELSLREQSMEALQADNLDREERNKAEHRSRENTLQAQLDETIANSKSREREILQAVSDREKAFIDEKVKREKELLENFQQTLSTKSDEARARETDLQDRLNAKNLELVQVLELKNSKENEHMSKISALEATVKHLENTLREQKLNTENIASKLADKEKQCLGLESELNVHKQHGANADQALTRKIKQLSEAKEDGKRRELQLMKQMEQLSNNKQRALDDLREQHERIIKQLSNSSNELATVKSEYEAYVRDSKLREEQNISHIQRLQAEARQLDEVSARRLREQLRKEGQLVGEVDSLERSLHEAREVVSEKTRREVMLSNEREQDQSIISNLRRQIAELETSNAKLRENKNSMERQLRAEIEVLNNANQAANADLAVRSQELKTVTERAEKAYLVDELRSKLAAVEENEYAAKLRADQARAILNSQEPWVGIEIAETLLEGYRRKLIVKSLAPNSPASHLDVLPHDIIEAVDGKSVRKTEELGAILASYKVGDVITLQISRGSSRRTVHLIISSRHLNYEDLILLRRVACPEEDAAFMRRFK